MKVLALILWVLHAMTFFTPHRQKHDEVAVAIAVTALEVAPLYQDDEDRHKTAALMVAIAFRESSYRPSIAGDCQGQAPGSKECTLEKARSLGTFQHDASRLPNGMTRAEFAADPYTQARTALKELRHSFQTCKEHPVAYYAHGRDPKVACANGHAQDISRWRMGDARAIRAKTDTYFQKEQLH